MEIEIYNNNNKQGCHYSLDVKFKTFPGLSRTFTRKTRTNTKNWMLYTYSKKSNNTLTMLTSFTNRLY